MPTCGLAKGDVRAGELSLVLELGLVSFRSVRIEGLKAGLFLEQIAEEYKFFKCKCFQ